MEKYVNQIVAIDTILSNPPEAHYPCWFAEQIAKLPAADVTEIVHGEWTYCSSHGEDECEYECSVCKDWANQRYSYCPNCGAKMDGEKNKRSVRVRAIKRKGR